MSNWVVVEFCEYVLLIVRKEVWIDIFVKLFGYFDWLVIDIVN